MRSIPARAAVLIFMNLVGLAIARGEKVNPSPQPSLRSGEEKPLSNGKPLSPREELTTFKVRKGFRVELAACEPDVVDPVAMAFDEEGRIYVAEMRGYPNAGVGTGQITSGRIKRLEDRDGDGFYEKSTLFAQGLRFPTAVMPWKGGLLVANAPDLIYLEDTNGDGQSDRQRILYTGFDLDNIQQLLNSLQWALDNHVHGVAGGKGGTIRSREKPEAPAVLLRGRGIRFRPDVPASLEPTSGGGQYGLAADAFGRWFTATNSQHLRHIVLPDHALRRNPALAVRAVTVDIPDHGAACKVYRISPFEAWRVERTTRRKDGPTASRFSPTELVPGGFITSGCSPLVYLADTYPEEYRGNVLVCDPANNLIHRDILEEKGATFVAKRADADCEFLASTDNWFRPVWLSLGPDGCVYVLDFYREVIETPLSLPDDIKKRLNLESRGRGRIWRIVPEGFKRPAKLALSKADAPALVAHLASDNAWLRLTAQRLLVERQDTRAVEPLRKLLSRGGVARVHALWTLHGLKALTAAEVQEALKDRQAGVREQALRLAEELLPRSPGLLRAVSGMVQDESPRVRFQTALTLGASTSPDRLKALAALLRHAEVDGWTQTAILASTGKQGPELLATLVRDATFEKLPADRQVRTIEEVATLAGVTASEQELGQLLDLLATAKQPAPWQAVLLEGLGRGLRQSQRSLSALLDRPPAELKKAVEQIQPFFQTAATTALDTKKPVLERLSALRLLAYAPASVAEKTLGHLLSPRHPAEVQLAAVRALAAQDRPSLAATLLSGWSGYTPALRRECLEVLFASPRRLEALLEALEKKIVQAGHLEPARLDQLRKHRDPKVRQRASKVLAGAAAPERQKVVEAYKSALELKADRMRGREVFKKNCATCHRLENEGYEVGPDLLATLKNKSREQLLQDLLDPSREVDSRYVNYQVTTTRGLIVTGLIATETASSLTLRRGDKQEDVLLRSQIAEITATGKSLMPEGLEMQLTKQDVADLIEYLLGVVK